MVAKTSRSMSRPPGTSHSGLRPLRYALPIHFQRRGKNRQKQNRDRKEKQGRALMSPLGLARVLKDRWELTKREKGNRKPKDRQHRKRTDDNRKDNGDDWRECSALAGIPPQRAHPTPIANDDDLPSRPARIPRAVRSGCWPPPQPILHVFDSDDILVEAAGLPPPKTCWGALQPSRPRSSWPAS